MTVRWAATEIAKNALMAFPGAARIRKRRYARRTNLAEEIERQASAHWPGYQAALEAAGLAGLVGGARVLELGPGPLVATGVHLIGAGARSYTAIDRFALFREDENARLAYRALVERLPADARRRCDGLVRPAGALFDDRIRTVEVSAEGAERRFPPASFDLIVSYNVLEHVDDLGATLRALSCLLAPRGAMVHRVDVSTHAPAWVGGQVMDQLTFPDWLWRAMYSRRAYPNRVRPCEYRRLAGEAGLESARFEVTGQVSREEVERFRPRLARRFRDCAWEDLATADFLWVLRHGTPSS